MKKGEEHGTPARLLKQARTTVKNLYASRARSPTSPL
jgi:hypothetical protein